MQTFVSERFVNDERYRKGHLNIIAAPAGTLILGMHTPEMKKVAKQIVASCSWHEQLSIWQNHRQPTGKNGLSHEERMIWGLVIDYARMPLTERLNRIDRFIPAIDNWAICDNFCCNSKWVEHEDKQQVWTYIVRLIDSTGEFSTRTGLVLALAHFLDAPNLPRTLETVAGMHLTDAEPYYTKMGAAWLFATALTKDFQAALPYLLNNKLDRWIHNKTIQKAIESRLPTAQQKNYLRTLRRTANG